jgi:membrane-associated phospholipid phosphatase
MRKPPLPDAGPCPATRCARRSTCAAALIAAIALGRALPAAAQTAQGPEWPADARRATPVEYVATGVLSVSALVLALTEPDEARTSGPWLFDDPARDALRLESPDARRTADVASDIGLWSIAAYPFVDALLAATVLKADRRVPVEMAIQSALVISAAANVAYLAKNLVARDRPFGPSCKRDPGYASECADNDPPVSFMSGHAAVTFSAATITCVQHFQLKLYQDPVADAAACAIPLALATAVSVARMLADQHYATDVLAGAAIGTLSGVGLGLLLHY